MAAGRDPMQNYYARPPRRPVDPNLVFRSRSSARVYLIGFVVMCGAFIGLGLAILIGGLPDTAAQIALYVSLLASAAFGSLAPSIQGSTWFFMRRGQAEEFEAAIVEAGWSPGWSRVFPLRYVALIVWVASILLHIALQ